MVLETDYLVVGAGASGLAFADALLAEADVEVTIVDRRRAPGGHWADAYPFVRLHTPSAYYGVSSLALGDDRVDDDGENAGFYERAGSEEIVDHFAAATERMEASGLARLLGRHEHLGTEDGTERIRDLDSGEVHEVEVRRRVVDARYLEASIPATHTPGFAVADGARFAPLNELPAAAGSTGSYTVLGAGKTAADACTWLLDNGVEPDRIRWVRPRDAWFYDRRHFQPLEQVASIMEGNALDAEAGAAAESVEDLFARLEDSGRMQRIDPERPATMFRGTMLSAKEIAGLRQIEDVVRLGRVRRIEPDRIVLERGEVETDTETLHVDCSALGLNDAPPTPIFQPGRIALQGVRHLSPCFNAALVGYVEATRDDDAEKNRLCPPNPYPASIDDWPGMVTRTWRAERRWLGEPDLSAWIAANRLNLLGGLSDRAAEPEVRDAVARFLENVGPASERLRAVDEARSARGQSP